MDAAQTRSRILAAAVDRASLHGLDSVTVGSVAGDVGMSKAGVVGPFGSRETLLTETLKQAVDVFRRSVVSPLADVPPGPPRISRLIDLWVDYLADGPFPGGCFITAASCELDNRPGPLREHIHAVVAQWREFLITELARVDELPPPGSPEDVATVLAGISMAANQEIQLLGDPTAAERARRVMRLAVGIGPP